jgi:ATP-binding cassette subfamily C protein CydC
MRELGPWLQPDVASYPRLALGAGLLLLTTGAAVGLLALAGWFITATALTGALIAAGASVSLNVFVPGAAIRAFAVTRTLARYGERLVNHDTVLRQLARIRVRVFADLARQRAAPAEHPRTATALQRLTSDVDRLDSLYLRALLPPPAAALAVLLVTTLIAIAAPRAAVLVGTTLGLAGLAAAWAAWRAGATAGEDLAAAQDDLRTRLLDLRAGLAELRAFASLDGAAEAIAALDRRRLAVGARLAHRAAAGEAATTLGLHTAAVLALGAGIAAYRDETLTGPWLVLVPLAVLALGETLRPIPAAILDLGRARAAARRLNTVAAPPADPAPATAQPAPRDATVAVQDVDLARGAAGAAPVLRRASLTLDAGERVAISGASGSGKSSLADLIAGLLAPDHGHVQLAGEALAELDEPRLRGLVAYLTQHTELFADTVEANLRLGRPDASAVELHGVLETVGLAALIHECPHGLASWIGESGLRLSGGEARRLALARVLLTRSPILVLDEPFTGVDAATAARITARLEPWLTGRTCVLLAHGTPGLPGLDRELAIAAGRLRPSAGAA